MCQKKSGGVTMRGISERVRRMKDGFMEQHNNGKSVSEIAEHFDVSTWSIYNNLQEIADKNGVERESLLKRVFTREETKGCKKEHKDGIEPEKLLNDFCEAKKTVKKVIETINNVLGEMQEER